MTSEAPSTGAPAPLDLSHAYTEAYTREVADFRLIVGRFLEQILLRQFVDTGFLAAHPAAALRARETYPSDTAWHFSRKLLEYFADRGVLAEGADGRYALVAPLADPDPEDRELEVYLAAHPHNRVLYGFLRDVRDVMGRVVFAGEDSLLTLVFEDFHKAMQLWTDLMEKASVKLPCHAVIVEALKRRLRAGGPVTVFEGGAGVGAVLREAVRDPGFLGLREALAEYWFTDVSLSLIKLGRQWLRERAPADLLERIHFRVVNLDALGGRDAPFAADGAVDAIVLEHVLYDVTDLRATLAQFRRMLRPGGILVFTMSYRQRPRDFFPFEFMQSSLGSYHHARLEPGYREQTGYLTLREWRASLDRAGFAPIEVYPAPADHHRWPFGGIVAHAAD